MMGGVVMLTLVLVVGAAAAGCAMTAAYVYLRPGDDHVRAEHLARRWLVATAVLGVTALCLRFGWLLLR
ncbi:hypothetical protein ABID74_003479 [Gordonia terrae]|nr:hypothetical protein BCM27_24310 [Gordonia terrae]GAB43826.1 hypothetical protein GOTRE_052_00330 [Gordonia terrae NBRC 100016]VTR08456.1 Uncharacterised protein [Clostridioides difficile]VTS63674.1 Uncharacterised protein [Gordonia terrae]